MRKIIVPNINSGKQPIEIKLTENNWPKDYPYCPEVTARLWHNGDNLYIQYEVDETHIMAKADHDNGEVWKDSCCEFFISFEDNGYYNIESSCIGKILMSHRTERKENVEYASKEILNAIKREASLGNIPFDCKESIEPWSLTLTLPATTFFKHDIRNFSEIRAKCNIYKCGDNLPSPHFISWQPIITAKPDFHQPKFFGEIEFER